MTENLIYPDKSPELIVSVRCKKCQNQWDAVGSDQNMITATCPSCQEKKDLLFILNNHKELDLQKSKKTLNNRQIMFAMIVCMALYILFRIIPFEIWSVIAVVALIIVFVMLKFFKIKK